MKLTLNQIECGIRGLFFWFIQYKVVPQEWHLARYDRCMKCAYRKKWFGLWRCSDCGCFLWPKTALLNEEDGCPKGYWT